MDAASLNRRRSLHRFHHSYSEHHSSQCEVGGKRNLQKVCYVCECASVCGTSIRLAAEASRLLESGGCERQAAALSQAMLQHHLELCTQTDHPEGKTEGERKDRRVTKHSLNSDFGLIALQFSEVTVTKHQ